MQTADFGIILVRQWEPAISPSKYLHPLCSSKVTLRLLNTNKGIPLNSVLSDGLLMSNNGPRQTWCINVPNPLKDN